MSAKIRVLIVDDSALIRAVLKEILESDPRLTVVAAAQDAYEARELIKQHNPDVLTLDIEMPKMNGITFLKNLMRLRPMPVVMISTLTQEGAPATLEALEIGAVDFVPKPQTDGGSSLEIYRESIVEKVVCAANANVRTYQPDLSRPMKPSAEKKVARIKNKTIRKNFICAIGASTGGTEAIKEVITQLPANMPPIVIVQHIPETFSASFAKRINDQSDMEVYEAQDNQKIEEGCVYIAPGHSHLRVALLGGKYVCKLDNGEVVNRHRPAVDVLFDSVLKSAKENAMSVLLTGMGADGAEGMLRMKQAQCLTLAQDEASSVVWGMPGAAVKLGAATQVLPLNKMAETIISAAYN